MVLSNGRLSILLPAHGPGTCLFLPFAPGKVAPPYLHTGKKAVFFVPSLFIAFRDDPSGDRNQIPLVEIFFGKARFRPKGFAGNKIRLADIPLL